MFLCDLFRGLNSNIGTTKQSYFHFFWIKLLTTACSLLATPSSGAGMNGETEIPFHPFDVQHNNYGKFIFSSQKVHGASNYE